MKIIFSFFLIFSSFNCVFATPEFSPKEAISYFGKTFIQAKQLLLIKGYKFDKQYKEFYQFKKKTELFTFICTIIIHKGKIDGIGTQEFYGEFFDLNENLIADGFNFEKGEEMFRPPGHTTVREIPSTLFPSSIYRFDKQKKYSCFLVCPENLRKGNELINLNYGKYTPN